MKLSINDEPLSYGDFSLHSGKMFYQQNNAYVNQIAGEDSLLKLIINIKENYMIITINEIEHRIEYIPSNLTLFLEILKDLGYTGMYKNNASN